MEYSAPRDLMEYGVLASAGGMGVLEYGVKLEYWSMEYGVWSIENFRRLRRADMRRLAAMITFCLGEAREKKRLLTFLFEKMEYGVLEYGAVGATEYGVLPASGRPGAMEYWSMVGRRPAGAAEYWSIGPAILLAGGQEIRDGRETGVWGGMGWRGDLWVPPGLACSHVGVLRG